MAKTELEKSKGTEKFREIVRSHIMSEMAGNGAMFWSKLAQMPPKEYFEIMLKLLPFGFAKVPEPKPLPDNNVLVEERVRRVRASVQQGLPEAEYEDEEGE